MTQPHNDVWAELRRLVPPLYLPILAMTSGMTIALPLIPLYLEGIGISLSMVGVIMGATGIGAALVGIPASAFAERFTNDHLMLVAVAASAVSLMTFGFVELAVVLVMLRLISGFGFGAMGQSRQLFVTRGVPIHFRGRVTSGMGVRTAWHLHPGRSSEERWPACGASLQRFSWLDALQLRG